MDWNTTVTADGYVRDPDCGVALIAPRLQLDYWHRQSCRIRAGVTAYEAYQLTTSHNPAWLRGAFWIRDRISALAGVEKIGGFNDSRPTVAPKVGEKLDFFRLVLITDNELLLTSEDRHLGVLISFGIAELDEEFSLLTVTASVKNRNRFGKLYMLPVGSAHKWIVNSMLKNIAV
ncbi:DUF2867 domain-containing protein [Oceanobacter mangrovi]|uniref:DUF2867 domain-containing protein n=1 Tax=Oceanobacter mangrovi TaxID=2862510 RepID=UPI001C8E2975|nr:DUF2867 domain-containing protein [Oceanobacter mangrovi]